MHQLPRILAIMGSGETAPTMVSVHADLLARLGPPPVPAVLLDTPFGFQENAAEICAKALQYFRENVGHTITVASFRSAAQTAEADYETMLARLREARYVFAGPGSPSYAIRQWQQSAVREVLADKLSRGGCVTFSSAAACTLGRHSLPVYEVYKVGAEPAWLPGLDLISEIGLDAVVVPHFNNAEGGTHDTRYCYMGERRLRLLEEQLEPATVVIGVDEHTACILDADMGTATVRGNGCVTVRRGERQRRLESGSVVPIAALGDPGGASPLERARPSAAPAHAESQSARARNPFMDGVAQRQADFEEALAQRDVDGLLAALLSMERHLVDWSRDTLDSDDMDRARSRMRTMLVQLADLARDGARDPREPVAPFVDAVLTLRREAREQHRFADADRLRDALLAAGVDIHDTPQGTGWELRAPTSGERAATSAAG